MSNTPARCASQSNRRGCGTFFIAYRGIDLETPFERGAVVYPVLTTRHGRAIHPGRGWAIAPGSTF